MIISCKQMMPAIINQVHYVVIYDRNLRNRSGKMINQISISARVGIALKIHA